jgi:hypothetical protein
MSHPLNAVVLIAKVLFGPKPAGAAGNEPVNPPPSLETVEVLLIDSDKLALRPTSSLPKLSVPGVTDNAAVSPWQLRQFCGA